MEFNNVTLNKDFKSFISSIKSIEIDKGDVGNYSIDVFEKATQSHSSYLYKTSKQRDEDYFNLLESIEEQLELTENN